MSTRKYLEARKEFFEFLLKKEPHRKGVKEAIDELEFILNSLKEYDRTNPTPNR